MKFRKAALYSIAGTLVFVPAAVAAGNANATPASAPKWAAVTTWNGQKFQVFDQATRENAESAARENCKRAFPAPIDLGSAKLNEAQCPTDIVFRSGQTAVRVDAPNDTYDNNGRRSRQTVSSYGVGSTRELAVMDARINNLKKYPYSGTTTVVWEARQA